MVICMKLRGPAGKPSIIGVKRCDGLDFVFLSIILVGAIVLTVIAIIITQTEYKAKEEAGYKFVKGDVKFT